jgi:hypothetical protein
MLRALWLTLTILAGPAIPVFADAPADPEPNAALKYWQAFATLPKFTDAENKRIADSLKTPLDDQARKILADAKYSLQMMTYGAAQPRCDWGVDFEDGIYTRLPQADAARVLCSLVCLRVRMRIEAGQNAEAIDDFIAGMTLGRHSSQVGTNIMLLTGYAIEHRLIETLALELPRLDPETLASLNNRLAALPAGSSPAEAMKAEEKSYLDWLVRIVKKAKDKESLLAELEFVELGSEGQPTAAGERSRAFVEKCGGTVEGVLRYSEQTRSSYRAVEKMLELPLDQFDQAFSREAKEQAGNPVFEVFFPAMGNVRRAQARMDVRRALLLAAIAVRRDGRDALKSHPDPVSGAPFEYIPFGGGFELRSTLKGRDDQPVALTVGPRN